MAHFIEKQTKFLQDNPDHVLVCFTGTLFNTQDTFVRSDKTVCNIVFNKDGKLHILAMAPYRKNENPQVLVYADGGYKRIVSDGARHGRVVSEQTVDPTEEAVDSWQLRSIEDILKELSENTVGTGADTYILHRVLELDKSDEPYEDLVWPLVFVAINRGDNPLLYARNNIHFVKNPRGFCDDKKIYYDFSKYYGKGVLVVSPRNLCIWYKSRISELLQGYHGISVQAKALQPKRDNATF